jgi:NRAMP (natural resistance-associated macrophage protein)-like metal ion transporter
LRRLGPGLIAGASDDDPSGIGTYAIAGAQLGYGPLWTAILTLPLMATVQYICAKIGMVNGLGLAGVLRQRYPRLLLYTVVVVLFIANTFNAGADLVAIAAGINLLVPVRVAVLICPLALIILALQIWGSYRWIANTFRWLTLSLFAYIASAFFARPAWGEVLRNTFWPTITWTGPFLATLVAILGTTISPYLFFWQASQEVEEKLALGRKRFRLRCGPTDEELKFALWDVSVGMILSNVVMYFIILATAATLHRVGQTNIESAAQAGEALRPLAGPAASVLMALGLIGTGLLTVPILTGSAAYAACEAFGWKCSLDAHPAQAKEFYLAIALSTLGALLIDQLGISAMHALFWAAVLNGFLAPPLLAVIMFVASDQRLMGKRVIGWQANFLGWMTTALMSAAALALVCSWI